MVKVTFLGDIMCEEPFLKAARTDAGVYDFSRAFAGLKGQLAASDYVVGNLETPLAGGENGYTHEMYSFNTPDQFANALLEAGVSAVLTANNHCGDRGTAGLIRTVRVLDELGLPHTGTFQCPEMNKPIEIDIGGSRIAVLSYTFNTNASRTGLELNEEHVNILQSQDIRKNAQNVSLLTRVKKGLRDRIKEENLYKLRRYMGKQPQKPTMDNRFDKEDVDVHLQKLKETIQLLKTEGRMVFVCPHMGGQFNREPGRLSEYIMDALSRMGADAIVSSHPHIVQKVEMKNGVACFFSLGNVSMSMSTLYILREDFPEIGLMTHFYIEGQRIRKITFSLLYMHEDATGFLYVQPMADVIRTAGGREREKLLHQAECVIGRIRQNKETIEDIEDEFVFYDSSGLYS